MEIPKRITLIDVRDKKYVLPVKLIDEDRLEPFLENAPPREKDSTPDDAIFKFPDPPDAIELMVYALQHGYEFYYFEHWEDHRTVLRNLLSTVRVGEKYHVYDLAHRAAALFDDSVKLHDDYFPHMNYGYGDFADTVSDLYRPDLPEGWQKMTPGELFFSRRAPRLDSRIPLLKRWAVQFAADHYYDMAYEDDCLHIFGEDVFMYPDGLHPFHKDVKKVMKRQKDIRTKSKGKKVQMDEEDWSDFFADERYVTLVVDRKDDEEYLLNRKDVLEQSTLLYDCPTKPWSKELCGEEYHFLHEVYNLPDHPHGVRAIADMIDDGPRYFDVPDDVQDKGLSIQYLSHALAAGDKYGVFGMREAVTGLLRCCGCDYLARCRKPSTIVHAIKTVYALKPHGKNDRLLRELKDRFVEWAVARGEGWDENAVRCACKKVPAFGEDVRKKHRAAEEGGKEDKDVDGGDWEDVDSGSEEDSDSGSEEDSDSSAEEDSDSNAGEGADDEET